MHVDRGFARTVAHDVEMYGRTIRPGEPVTLPYASANRDPNVFEKPDQFILHRANITSHLGFGIGRHRCAGMALARLCVVVSHFRSIILTLDVQDAANRSAHSIEGHVVHQSGRDCQLCTDA